MKTEQELEQSISTLTDLKDLPMLCEELEKLTFSHSSQPGESFYTRAHRELIPNRLSELWYAGLLLNGEPLEEFAYEKMEPVFQEYLSRNGMEGQECFLSVYPETVSEERPEEWTLRFFMGFDIFEGDAVEEGEEPNLPGWGVFKFTVHSWQYPSQSCKAIHQVPLMDEEAGPSSIDWNYYDTSGYYSGFYMERGRGMFYSRKTGNPFKGLWEVFSDGGYVLRLD